MSDNDAVTGSPLLVLLHAFPVNRELWLPVADLLAARGVRCVVPDLPGFGESPVSTLPPDVAVLADGVLATMDDLGIDQFPVAGLSMGGYVLMALLRRAPERISAIALVDTKMAADLPAAGDKRLAVAQRAEAEASTEFLVEAVIPQLLGPVTLAQRPQVVAQVSDWIRSADPAGVAWAQRAMAVRPDSAATLAGFAGPALVLAGADDAISPPAEQRQIADVLSDGDLALIEGAGHLSAIEDPVAVADALATWLQRVPGSTTTLTG